MRIDSEDFPERSKEFCFSSFLTKPEIVKIIVQVRGLLNQTGGRWCGDSLTDHLLFLHLPWRPRVSGVSDAGFWKTVCHDHIGGEFGWREA